MEYNDADADPEIQFQASVSADVNDKESFYQPLTRPSELEVLPSPDLVPFARLASLHQSKYMTVRITKSEPAYEQVPQALTAPVSSSMEPDIMLSNAEYEFAGFDDILRNE
jgi:hypothetical protein